MAGRKVGVTTGGNIQGFQVDSESTDIASLPTDVGSESYCICLDTKAVYIFGTSWIKWS